MTDTLSDSDILCGCAALSRSQARHQLDKSPEQSFDEFLRATNSGSTCTACMLDLEYFFVETPRRERPTTFDDSRSVEAKIPLKQLIYGMLDSFAWQLPYNRTNWMPVFYGAGFDQYLWMTNRDVLFGETDLTVDFIVKFAIRDETGKVLRREKFSLKRGQSRRVNLSEGMPSSDVLRIGSIALDRFGRRPGLRGTTRPQTEIVGPSGASSLHFQAAGRRYSADIALCVTPNSEKVGFSAVNAGPDTVTIRLRYFGAQDGIKLKEEQFALPPFACRLHWVDLPEIGQSGATTSLVVLANYEGIGLSKMHLVIADADLGRLSLDHL